jgi:hypothetical protein
MKVYYKQRKGRRIKKGTVKVRGRKHRVRMFHGLCIYGCDLWWCDEVNKWIDFDYFSKHHLRSCGTTNNKIKSVAAAVAHVKRHDEIPKGTEVWLHSNFKGFDVKIIK